MKNLVFVFHVLGSQNEAFRTFFHNIWQKYKMFKCRQKTHFKGKSDKKRNSAQIILPWSLAKPLNFTGNLFAMIFRFVIFNFCSKKIEFQRKVCRVRYENRSFHILTWKWEQVILPILNYNLSGLKETPQCDRPGGPLPNEKNGPKIVAGEKIP